MKYFTANLLAMGITDDDRVLDEQERLWDEAGDRYVAYLETVESMLPPGLRQLHDNYYLHDAVVLGMGQYGSSFVVVLQLDTPPNSLLTLTYALAAQPSIAKDVLPAGLRTAGYQVLWQYDEIEQVPGSAASWAQSILLSNGWEVKLHFRDVAVQEAQPLLPIRPCEPRPVVGSA